VAATPHPRAPYHNLFVDRAVVWTQEALDDLDGIGAFHARTSPAYAGSLVERLYEAVVVLEDHPPFGRKVPEINHDLVRELIVERYRVVYQRMRDRVEIVAVLHSRQDLVKKFKEWRRDA
jgi:plasmid stabilization system protein ParE